MRGLHPLLLEDLEIAAPGVRVLRLCLNRHLPETHWVRTHRHDFSQVLFYLSGSGWQTIEGERIPVSTGRAIGIPAGVRHAFVKEKARSPLCLVVDFEVKPGRSSPEGSVLVASESQTEIRRCLSWLARHQARIEGGGSQVRECGVVLQIVGHLMECLAPENAEAGSGGRRFSDRSRRFLEAHPVEQWTGEAIAGSLNVARDHLNRRVKAECGLTTGQLIAEHRLKRVRKQLEETDLEIQEIAARSGILDRNYFARWFRKQTGLTPTAWRRRHRPPGGRA